jgi:hypothetical protein
MGRQELDAGAWWAVWTFGARLPWRLLGVLS